jgi:hypothetical protein
MLAYVPAIHVFLATVKTWMPGTSPGMTNWIALLFGTRHYRVLDISEFQ